MDVFFSLSVGRPSGLRLSYVNCELPAPTDHGTGNDSHVANLYERYKYEFVKDVASEVLELSLTAQPPEYQTILDLDKKLREKVPPKELTLDVILSDDSLSVTQYMRVCSLCQFRAATTFYIHRPYFAQAMLDHPTNPFQSPYAPSFLAAYRCASEVIQLSGSHSRKLPEICIRWWSFWTNLLSSAIIVGSIVIRVPTSPIVPRAYAELGRAVDIFEDGAENSHRAKHGLTILRKMRQQAERVYSKYNSRRSSTAHEGADDIDPDFGVDELSILGGRTRLFYHNSNSVASTLQRSQPTNNPAPLVPPADFAMGESSTERLPPYHEGYVLPELDTSVEATIRNMMSQSLETTFPSSSYEPSVAPFSDIAGSSPSFPEEDDVSSVNASWTAFLQSIDDFKHRSTLR
ncbi:hypothetical protein HGRIS_002580 [Hohenbuehelia grisea]|uniref:Uncharacterized protein n=1 Tax=Hohenbuehelia grisea TaxID=104357 RepID=A0ABR3JM45_9AGAR